MAHMIPASGPLDTDSAAELKIHELLSKGCRTSSLSFIVCPGCREVSRMLIPFIRLQDR